MCMCFINTEFFKVVKLETDSLWLTISLRINDV